ncbi:MAG TPA: 16S rRNA (uracil(1498)-N(3))-methyltransferase [Marmoricola sp.]|nr:16S rRNA (uracil(1498)-N(3))-methyltransferase [Marmoricola sp.]
MTLPVFLSADVTGATAGSLVVLEGDEGRHAAVVRRVRAGERVVLTDGGGTAATCEVVGTSRSGLTATVTSVSVTAREEPEITVVQAIPKGDRGELAVEMLTEVGVDRIVPWAAARCVAVWRGDRLEKALTKWRATSREAAKQARRAWFPSVSGVASTPDVADLLSGADLAVVLHEAATAPLADLSVAQARSVVVVVGPEGGLTDEELAAFDGAQVVRLGSSVLRTSTAGVAAVAALLARTPRWR